ncbi:MAG: hypothetical protein ACRBN8_00415 [Nannocystales bacterium]
MNHAKTISTILPLCLASLGACADPCFDDGLGQKHGDATACAALASASATETNGNETAGGDCDNGVQDGDETDVDCGGSCMAGCGMGEGCVENGDCESNDCDADAGSCGAGDSGGGSGGGGTAADGTAGGGSCDDGMQNQDETDVDCGGSCGATCEGGEVCSDGGDCVSDACGDDGTCEDGTLWCSDTDGDGFGDPDVCTTVPDGETPPDGTVDNDDDCDDNNASTFPGAAPNDDAVACMKDEDGDDWGDTDVPDGVQPGADCDDGEQSIPPGCMSVDVSANPGNILSGGSSSLLAEPMLGDGDYTFDWSPAASLDNTGIAGPQATPATSTTYQVDVTDGQGEQAAGLVTVHVTDTAVPLAQCQPLDAAALGVDLGNHPTPLWAYTNDDTQACETANGDPAALVCDIVLDDASFTSRFEVQSNDDDDQLGFVWGYQDAGHFYLFTWRAEDQTWSNCGDTFAPEGMVVKRIDAGLPLACEDLLGVADTPNSTTLLDPDDLSDQGWNYNEEYVFELSHAPQDFTMTVRRAADDSVVAQATVVDDTYPSGRFGPYTFSQEGSCFWELHTSAN